MAVINFKKREIQIKVVYYGPGRGGKTTNLEHIYRKNKNRSEVEPLKIETPGKRTLLFDFLLFDLGKIYGFEVIIHLYTAPGQQRYHRLRRMVLNGVDGVVFVADGMAMFRDRNRLSFHRLKEDLAYYNKTFDETPLVIQCNKSDLAKSGVSILSTRTIARDLSVKKGTPVLAASALSGLNVISTLKQIIALTLRPFERELKKHGANPVSSPTPVQSALPARPRREGETMGFLNASALTPTTASGFAA